MSSRINRTAWPRPGYFLLDHVTVARLPRVRRARAALCPQGRSIGNPSALSRHGVSVSVNIHLRRDTPASSMWTKTRHSQDRTKSRSSRQPWPSKPRAPFHSLGRSTCTRTSHGLCAESTCLRDCINRCVRQGTVAKTTSVTAACTVENRN